MNLGHHTVLVRRECENQTHLSPHTHMTYTHHARTTRMTHTTYTTNSPHTSCTHDTCTTHVACAAYTTHILRVWHMTHTRCTTHTCCIHTQPKNTCITRLCNTHTPQRHTHVPSSPCASRMGASGHRVFCQGFCLARKQGDLSLLPSGETEVCAPSRHARSQMGAEPRPHSAESREQHPGSASGSDA